MPQVGPTEPQLTLIEKVYARGKSVKECAALIGFSPSTVHRHLRKRGVWTKRPSYTNSTAPGGVHMIFDRHGAPSEKWCGACREYWSVSEFFRNRSNSTGYASACKACESEKYRSRRERRGEEA